MIDEIKKQLLKKYPNAEDVEIRQVVSSEGNETIYLVAVTFFSDYDLNFVVAPYGTEYLDFYLHSFSTELEREANVDEMSQEEWEHVTDP